MQELVKQLKTLTAQIDAAMAKLNLADDRRRAEQLQVQTEAADFWNQAESAAAVSRQLADLSRRLTDWDSLKQKVEDALEIAVAAATEGFEDTSLEAEVAAQLAAAQTEFDQREFELKLAGPYDRNPAILSIYAGTGGTDAQDWAAMLLRMYLRWCERRGLVTNLLDQSAGEEAGLKSVTLEVNGALAFGLLKGEKGVHRLVRLSPFNADNLRQTSFAMVDVLPQIEQQPQFDIDPKDLRVDVFRSGGHGGQSVNTTDSAVRITHLPTGLVVSIQNERSQLQNKDKAMAVLRARLAALMLEQHKATIAELKGAPEAIAWGNQIRSYVLHPYTKVKDHRTGHETSQAQAVLDGGLDEFIDAYLAGQIGQDQK